MHVLVGHSNQPKMVYLHSRPMVGLTHFRSSRLVRPRDMTLTYRGIDFYARHRKHSELSATSYEAEQERHSLWLATRQSIFVHDLDKSSLIEFRKSVSHSAVNKQDEHCTPNMSLWHLPMPPCEIH